MLEDVSHAIDKYVADTCKAFHDSCILLVFFFFPLRSGESLHKVRNCIYCSWLSMKLNSSRSHSNTLAALNLTFAVVYLNTETEHCTSCGEEMEFSIAHTELQPVIMVSGSNILSKFICTL